MKATIYCKPSAKGIHTFYLTVEGRRYYLFNQNYRKGVQDYFGRGVSLNEAMNYSKSHNDRSVVRTMSKIPMYVKYVEREYGIAVFEQTKKRNDRNFKYCKIRCA